jgi:hypothetical protein
MVYLTLTDRYGDPSLDARPQFTRPCNVKQGKTFRVLIHIDLVEDLTFYYYPLEQLIAEGKVHLREFFWSLRLPNGNMDEEDIRLIERYCRLGREHRKHPRDDDDNNSERRRPRGFEILRGLHAGLITKGGVGGQQNMTIEVDGSEESHPIRDMPLLRAYHHHQVKVVNPQKRREPCDVYGQKTEENKPIDDDTVTMLGSMDVWARKAKCHQDDHREAYSDAINIVP